MCLNVQEPDNQNIKKYLEYGVSQGFNSRYLGSAEKVHVFGVVRQEACMQEARGKRLAWLVDR